MNTYYKRFKPLFIKIFCVIFSIITFLSTWQSGLAIAAIDSSIKLDKSDVLSNLRGWQFPTETNVHKRHVFLKLKNYEDVVDMYYSLDGKNWTKTTNSFDISGYHHNVLGEFLAVRIALVSIGEGSVTFKDFNYQPIE